MEKKPFYKRTWFIVLVILFVIGACTSGGDSDVHESSSSIEQTKTSDTSSSEETPAPTKVETQNTFQEATVTRVVDGDTIYVKCDGQEHKLRFIGVDTPETKHPRKPVQYFGKEAAAYTSENLPVGKTVWLQKDVSDTDKYGRLLRYVWVKQPATNEPTVDEIKSGMFNAILVMGGYAAPSTYPPDVKYSDLFLELSQDARNNGWGLWGAPAGSENNIPENLKTDAQKQSAPSDQTTTQPSQQPTNSYETTQAPAGATYVGNANTGKFHHPTCYSVRKMNPANQVIFNSREEAVNSGYSPCQNCNP